MRQSRTTAKSTTRHPALARAAHESLESRTLFATYYVDVATGADTNPGLALDAPFQSIARASQVAAPGDTVLIRQGTYRETLAPQSNGAVDNPITYKPYNNEPVTLTGLDALPSSTVWTQDSGNVYKTQIPLSLGDQNQIFLDGKPLVEARWPNLPYPTSASQPDYLDLKNYATAKSATSRTSGRITPSSSAGLPAGADLVGADLTISGGARYSNQTGQITSAVGKGGSVSFKGIDPFSFLLPRAASKYYISGKRVLLDAPGEWFYDAPSQTLYVYAPAGDSPANHSVEVKARTAAVDLSDRDDITVQGITALAGSLVTNNESDRNTFDSINSVWGAYTAVIPFGTFDASTRNPAAVVLNGSENTLSNSSVTFSTGDGVTLLGHANSVVNNTIHDVDLNATYAAGITIIGQGYLVYRNSIFDTGRSGIRARGFPENANTGAPEAPRAVRAGRIAYNDVYRYGRVSNDLAGIELNGDAEGGGTVIDHNWIHDNASTSSRGFRGTGIYLDNGADRFTIHHNVMFNNGDSALWLNASDGGAKNRFGQSVGNRIFNNTSAGGHRRGFVINGQRLRGKTTIDAFGTRFANNTATEPPGPVYLSTAKFTPGHAPQLDHNIATGVANRAANDFRTPGALGKGVNTGLMDNPGGTDAGAYESGQNWVPGSVSTPIDPSAPIPGAGGDDLQTVVDGLTDLSRAFSAPNFVIETGPVIDGFETGTARRGSASSPSITYRYDDIEDFAIKFFGAPATVQILGSADGVTFSALPVSFSAPAKKGKYVTARPQGQLPADTNYLRIDLSADATRLAQAEFTYHDRNLALARHAQANHFNFTLPGDFRGDNATDLNPATLWRSQDQPNALIPLPILTIDLGSPQPISTLRLSLLKLNGVAADDYTIETSNDLQTWSTLYSVTNGTAAQGAATVVSDTAKDRTRVDLTGRQATARFIRITGDGSTTLGLWDFQAYTA